ncbi:MAG: tetratricopeptide repeat protein [Planctomycetes bacterium]|nr:tetratricopeptide repeat protein [Planctomycetota bacterium]
MIERHLHNRRNTRTHRVWVLLLALMVTLPATVHAQEKVDPAVKKLMAANGFFERGMYDTAEQEYAAFLKDNPDHPEAVTAKYGMAVCRYKQNQFDKAAETLSELVKIKEFPQKEEALAVLGHCYLASNANDKALAAFDQLLKEYPQSQHAELASINRVQVLYLVGKKEEAAAAGRAFIDRYPKSDRLASALYFTAVSLTDTGKLDQASATLKELIKNYPETSQTLDAILLLGQTYEIKGDHGNAQAQYQRLITNANGSRKAEGFYAYGVSLFKSKKYPEATEKLQAVLKEYPESEFAAPAMLQLGLTQLAAGDTAKARATLATVIEKDKTRANTARYWLAQADINEKAYDRAYKTLDELAKQDPPAENLEAVLFDRACCLMAMEKFEPAAKEFAAFREKYPSGAQANDALYRQAFSLHKLGQYEKSLALSSNAAKDASSSVYGPARELTAENLFLLQKYTDAAPILDDLLKNAQGNAKSRFSYRLGQCAYFTRDYANAAALLGDVVADKESADATLMHDAVFLLGDALLQLGDYAGAEKSLGDYLATAPGDKLEAQYKLAVAQIRGGHGDQAAGLLGEVAKGPADSPWVMRATFELGQLQYQNKQYEPAAAALKQVVASKAGEELKAPAAYLLAWIDFDNQRYPEAATGFSKMAAAYPTHTLAPAAAFQHAVAVKESGKAAEAMGLLGAFVKNYPNSENAGNARYLIGVCQAQLGQNDEAIKTFTALSDDKATRSDTVLYELAWARRNNKDNDGAADAYRQILKDFPTSSRAAAAGTELAELLYASGKYADAVKLLEAVSADSTADANTLGLAQYRLGWSYSKLGQQERAASCFNGFAEKLPDHELAPSAVYQAGVALIAANKNEQAEKLFTQLVTRYPKSELAPAGLLKLGELAATRGDFKQSKAAYERYFADFPKDKFAYLGRFGLGWAHENLKEIDRARECYAAVIESHNGPTAARAQFQIGETYFAQGDYTRAVKELLTVDIVYAYPEWSAPALYEAGRAYEQLNRFGDAKTQYRQCVTKYKETPEARLAGKRLSALGG